jgi:hypothetical protein
MTYATLSELKTWTNELEDDNRHDEMLTVSLETASAQIDALTGRSFEEVPSQIRMACLILATRFFLRRNSPTGAMGFEDLGAMRLSGSDPDVKALLAPFTKLPFGAYEVAE